MCATANKAATQLLISIFGLFVEKEVAAKIQLNHTKSALVLSISINTFRAYVWAQLAFFGRFDASSRSNESADSKSDGTTIMYFNLMFSVNSKDAFAASSIVVAWHSFRCCNRWHTRSRILLVRFLRCLIALVTHIFGNSGLITNSHSSTKNRCLFANITDHLSMYMHTTRSIKAQTAELLPVPIRKARTCEATTVMWPWYHTLAWSNAQFKFTSLLMPKIATGGQI